MTLTRTEHEPKYIRIDPTNTFSFAFEGYLVYSQREMGHEFELYFCPTENKMVLIRKEWAAEVNDTPAAIKSISYIGAYQDPEYLAKSIGHYEWCRELYKGMGWDFCSPLTLCFDTVVPELVRGYERARFSGRQMREVSWESFCESHPKIGHSWRLLKNDTKLDLPPPTSMFTKPSGNCLSTHADLHLSWAGDDVTSDRDMKYTYFSLTIHSDGSETGWRYQKGNIGGSGKLAYWGDNAYLIETLKEVSTLVSNVRAERHGT